MLLWSTKYDISQPQYDEKRKQKKLDGEHSRTTLEFYFWTVLFPLPFFLPFFFAMRFLLLFIYYWFRYSHQSSSSSVSSHSSSWSSSSSYTLDTSTKFRQTLRRIYTFSSKNKDGKSLFKQKRGARALLFPL